MFKHDTNMSRRFNNPVCAINKSLHKAFDNIPLPILQLHKDAMIRRIGLEVEDPYTVVKEFCWFV